MFRALCLLFGLAVLTATPASAGSFQTVHTFASGDDGANPTGGMILAKGKLYGTTDHGGADDAGTLFEFDPASGESTILYAFQGGDDGANPVAAPLFHKGLLYGTTRGGGAGYGTVFAFNIDSGELTTLYSFSGADDGAEPAASLRFKANALYGTTALGGVHGCENYYGCGTAFKIDLTAGELTTLFAFPADLTDGEYPESGLLLKHNLLFGSTSSGGILGGEQQAGTVFALDPATQALTTLHVFSGLDGASPWGNLLFSKGTLFGTTIGGGNGCEGGCGTLFSISPSGADFTTLHVFTGTDGRDPKGGLIFKKGMIYGTTLGGGTGCSTNCGTVFSYNLKTGALTTLYNFTDGADGEQPWGGLVFYHKVFYGTTELGADGYGTIFALKP